MNAIKTSPHNEATFLKRVGPVEMDINIDLTVNRTSDKSKHDRNRKGTMRLKPTSVAALSLNVTGIKS